MKPWLSNVVPATGLEPVRPKAADFKSAASTIPPGGLQGEIAAFKDFFKRRVGGEGKHFVLEEKKQKTCLRCGARHDIRGGGNNRVGQGRYRLRSTVGNSFSTVAKSSE